MTNRMTAQECAIHACGDEDEIYWLQPRGTAEDLTINVRSRETFRQMTVSLGLGALLTFGSAGAAVGPAAASTAEAETRPATASVEVELATPVAPLAAPQSEIQLPAAQAPVVADFCELKIDGKPESIRPIFAAVATALPSQIDRPARDPRELIQFDDMRVPRWIVETILRAAEVTEVDPVYMMALADKESSFIPANKASTSSAEGLFQFISSTWLEVVKTFGAKHGLKVEAAAIETIKGDLTVQDDAMREHVLGLRRDPYLSALMAAEMMKRDRSRMEQRLGRPITRSEFYLAHFFGVDSASKFMSLVDGNSKQSASRSFPAAAKANKNLFFAKNGKKTRHLSVAEVYAKLDKMIDKRLDRYEDVTTVVTADASY